MSRKERSTKLDDLKAVALWIALNESKGSPTEAAKRLGVSRATIYRWMRKYEDRHAK